MSKSLKRVEAALTAAGTTANFLETPDGATTAADAARALACHVDQIAKSIIFEGQDTQALYLFITAGTNRVDETKAAHAAGEALGRADAKRIRSVTGFAIGGVSPVGHKTPIAAFIDKKLKDFDRIYAAAGTPHHVFQSTYAEIKKISNAKDTDFIA